MQILIILNYWKNNVVTLLCVKKYNKCHSLLSEVPMWLEPDFTIGETHSIKYLLTLPITLSEV